MSKVIDVVKLVGRCLGYDMMVDDIEADATLTASDEKNKKDIITAINHTVSEIAISLIPFVAVKTVTVSGGKFNLSRLPERIFRVLALWQNGVDIQHEVKGENLYALDGTYELEYRFVPATLTENDDLPFFPYPVEKLVAYGSAIEACLVTGRISEAWNWHRAYEIERECALKNHPPKSKKIKARAWA